MIMMIKNKFHRLQILDIWKPNEELALRDILHVQHKVWRPNRDPNVVRSADAPKRFYLSRIRVPRQRMGPRPAWINDIQVLNVLSYPLDAYSTAPTPPQV